MLHMKTVEELQGSLYLAAKNKKTKFNILKDKILRMDVLEEAWKRVRENRGTEGIDRESIEDIERKGVQQFLQQLQNDLRNETYRTGKVRRVFIPKGDGKLRPLGIPNIRDRIVQQAVKLIIEPIFEVSFQDFSYAYRPGRSAKDASAEIYKWLNFGFTRIIDADIHGFFDHIDHEILMELVEERISDGYILKLIKEWLRAGIVFQGNTIYPQEGTPQGGVISPLLANIYLNSLDRQWVRMGMDSRYKAHLVRFADDVVILMKGNSEKVLEIFSKLIKALNLELNMDKTRLTTAEDGFDFLGIHFIRRYEKWRNKDMTRMFPSAKSVRKFRDKVRDISSRKKAFKKDESTVIAEMNTLIRGWTGYFNHTNASRIYRSLSKYIYWRLWKFFCFRHKVRHSAMDSRNGIRFKQLIRGLLPLTGRISYLRKSNAAG